MGPGPLDPAQDRQLEQRAVRLPPIEQGRAEGHPTPRKPLKASYSLLQIYRLRAQTANEKGMKNRFTAETVSGPKKETATAGEKAASGT